MSGKVLVLPGDGIGVEVVPVALTVMSKVAKDAGIDLHFEEGLIGGVAIDRSGTPLPEATLNAARSADIVLFGGVGGPKWDHLPMSGRPERGLLRLRAELGLFANLRPALLFAPLAAASSLKPELVADLDILILRELTGGIYFGEPRGVREENGEKVGFNTDIYREHEIERIARVAFQLAERRNRRVCSVDKANVLEVTQFWRDVVTRVHQEEFAHIELSHMYVDNAGMQLVRAPKQFDVIVTGNMFGDILSDVAAMLTGSLGMLPSASLGATGHGLFEPVHGTAPDIAGKNFANPLATILSAAMAFRYTLNAGACADQIERAVGRVLADGVRTRDIAGDSRNVVGTREMGEAVLAAL
ncbi:MAG: 3-isopropylmalate dehydrogenase [Gammaproteobacteria bacterium]|nr:3-isopropylmalate dehydrogenase [Gammaproteobacteria bacterium]